MARDVAGGIALDNEVEVAGFDIGGDRGVGAGDFFALDFASLGVGDIESRGERDVLADGKAEDAIVGGELEAVDGGVVRDLLLLGDGELLELVRLEDGGVLWPFCSYVRLRRSYGAIWVDRTGEEELQSPQCCRRCHCKRDPFCLENSSTADEQSRGDIHAKDVVGGHEIL